MERQIRIMLFKDRSFIITFVIVLWVVLIYTLTVVSSLAPLVSVRSIALTVGIFTGLSVTSASIAVLAHLKINGNQLYSEDIMWSKKK